MGEDLTNLGNPKNWDREQLMHHLRMLQEAHERDQKQLKDTSKQLRRKKRLLGAYNFGIFAAGAVTLYRKFFR